MFWSGFPLIFQKIQFKSTNLYSVKKKRVKACLALLLLGFTGMNLVLNACDPDSTVSRLNSRQLMSQPWSKLCRDPDNIGIPPDCWLSLSAAKQSHRRSSESLRGRAESRGLTDTTLCSEHTEFS